MSLRSVLEQLAAYRTKNTRESQDAFRNGLLVLQKKGLNKLGDDGKSSYYTRLTSCLAGWTFLE